MPERFFIGACLFVACDLAEACRMAIVKARELQRLGRTVEARNLHEAALRIRREFLDSRVDAFAPMPYRST